jgi:hypothetical protein
MCILDQQVCTHMLQAKHFLRRRLAASSAQLCTRTLECFGVTLALDLGIKHPHTDTYFSISCIFTCLFNTQSCRAARVGERFIQALRVNALWRQQQAHDTAPLNVFWHIHACEAARLWFQVGAPIDLCLRDCARQCSENQQDVCRRTINATNSLELRNMRSCTY